MTDLEGLLDRLVQNRVEFVVVGGYAAMAHGVSLMTKDIDVCTHFSRANLERIHRAVADIHPYHFLTPQELPFLIPPGFEERLKNLYIGTDLGRVDFLGDVAGIGGYDSTLAESIEVHLPLGTFRLLSRKAMIKAKSAMDRPHDKIAVLQLRAIEARGVPEPE